MDNHFRGFTIEHLPRKSNGEADGLAKKAAKGEAMPLDVFFEILTAPSTRPDKQPLSTVNAITSLDWRAPIIAFLHGHYEPVETHDFKRMQARARGYVLKDDNLFKLGVCAPLLKCITQEQGIELMKEIHEGMCGSHIAATALAAKAFRQGFYWPIAIRDAVDGRLSYQSSYGFASEQIHCHSQGTLLPSSGEPKVSNLWNKCATQGFNLVKQEKLSFNEPNCI
jgi:hypothetical protein